MFYLEFVPGMCVHKNVYIGDVVTIPKNIVRKLKSLSCYPDTDCSRRGEKLPIYLLWSAFLSPI